jgi:hypothetical protein
MQNAEILYGLLGVILGFLTSVAVFRARFVAIEKDVENLKGTLTVEIRRLHEDAAREWERIRAEIRAVCQQDDGYRDRMERRSRAELEVLASIARKLGAQHRITDPGSFDDDTSAVDRIKG